jgi:hypothetical protein
MQEALWRAMLAYEADLPAGSKKRRPKVALFL